METISVRRVVELLYGKGPEREFYPEDIDLGEIVDEADDSTESIEGAKFLRACGERLKEINKTIAALEVLGRQCECTVEHDNMEA